MTTYSDTDLDEYVAQAKALSRSDRAARKNEITAEIAKLKGYARPTTQQRALDDALSAELAAISTANDEDDVRLAEIRRSAAGGLSLERGAYGDYRGSGDSDPSVHVPFRGNPWDAGERMEVRDRARRALDTLARDKQLPGDEHAVEKVTRALDGHDGGDLDRLAAWTAATSDPAYRSAFMRLFADPEHGHREFSDAELGAFRRVQSLSRAMSLTDSQGGFLIPFQLDPSVIISNSGSVNPIRQISRVVVATGDTWNGVSSAGVTAEWLAEAVEAADASPTLAQPSIVNHKASAFVPVSFEAFGDMADGAAEVAKLLTDAKEQLEAKAFVTGTGTGQPFGVATAMPAGSKVATAAADVLASGDVYALQEALPPRFQGSAQWLANLATHNQIARFETTAGARLFPEINASPPRLLRKPIHEASHLNKAGNTATAGNDNVMVYGDWSHWVITDRIGTSIELVQNLFGANRRPTGQRGWLMWSRVGADAVVDAAFRLLTA